MHQSSKSKETWAYDEGMYDEPGDGFCVGLIGLPPRVRTPRRLDDILRHGGMRPFC